MKLNMICIKFHPKVKKNLKKLNFGVMRFFLVFLKNLVFSKQFSIPDVVFHLPALKFKPRSL